MMGLGGWGMRFSEWRCCADMRRHGSYGTISLVLKELVLEIGMWRAVRWGRSGYLVSSISVSPGRHLFTSLSRSLVAFLRAFAYCIRDDDFTIRPLHFSYNILASVI
jgi:hypothetical protein